MNSEQGGNSTEEKMKEHQQHKSLVASELGDLFANYIGDSLFCCVYEHHLEVVEDSEVKEFLTIALKNSKKHLESIKEIYSKENIPLPVGFGEQDIRRKVPRLFSDLFMVFYVTEMGREALITYGSALSTSFRQDVISHFEMCIKDSIEIYKQGQFLLLSKGMNISPAAIPYPKKVDFVEKESFISAIAGKNRALTAMEIKQLQINLNTNTLGKSLMVAFSQIAESEELRKYFHEGSKLAEKQIIELSKTFQDDSLPSPKLMDAHITDSTISPFSDKLLLFHTVLANGSAIQNYGLAVSTILRHDIHLQFAGLTVGIAKYVNDGTKLMIKKGWLEEPPTSADRDKLSKMSHGNQPVE
ncbi:hypothetical protein CR203_08815 [Salipaludibacillus neizhouensis]|uniref:Uncharacterized protein n=1 Tax=Salipaludibacillus neizhouensis TaxID=885475 RepID=A0A3A9K7J2_9BACI|nr:DUF3231 family protein [Salipaludibacillus neizhouensis]RKL67448.1 hypothetical protein CR203_08815 [Salipaludibacillus neizhouensis]